MRASRLLSTLILLQTRGRLSAEALARHFGVSVRTVYRDVDQLSAAGVPVFAERGRNGGFSLLDGYRTTLTGLTPVESEALLLAGVGKAAADLGIGAEAAAAQLKMLASLPARSGARAERVGSRFHLDPLNWYARPEAPEILPRLATAAWNDLRVRIEYQSWKGGVTRDIDPLGLVLKAGIWYLVGSVGDRPRTYRVANIRRLDVLEAKFRRPARFDLGRYWAESARDFESRLLADRATVRLSPEGLRILREVSPAAAEAADRRHVACNPAGWIQSEIPVENPAYATRQLLSLGAEVEVLVSAATAPLDRGSGPGPGPGASVALPLSALKAAARSGYTFSAPASSSNPARASVRASRSWISTSSTRMPRRWNRSMISESVCMPVASMNGTLPRRITTVSTCSCARSTVDSSFSAAPKKNGPSMR